MKLSDCEAQNSNGVIDTKDQSDLLSYDPAGGKRPFYQKEREPVHSTPYIIRGGLQGRERLRVLSRVMQPATLALLQRLGVGSGMQCLDVGCGGGDVAFELARFVGPQGHVVATDVDSSILDLARREGEALPFGNLAFRCADVMKEQPEQHFDMVYARFLLTHLPQPEQALQRMHQALRPGGMAVLVDIDFRGYFSEPDSPAFWRYVDLHTRTMQRRGGNPNIGLHLPALLEATGFDNVQMNIVQPAATYGDVKLITPLTMENIADAVEREGLATRAELNQLIDELYQFANMPGTVGCLPRIVEAWGYIPE